MSNDSPEEIRERALRRLLMDIKDAAAELIDTSVEDEEEEDDEEEGKVIYLDQEALIGLWDALEKYEIFDSTMKGVH